MKHRPTSADIVASLTAVKLLIKGMNGAIASRNVTYDFARLMDSAPEIKCPAFGRNIVDHMS